MLYDEEKNLDETNENEDELLDDEDATLADDVLDEVDDDDAGDDDLNDDDKTTDDGVDEEGEEVELDDGLSEFEADAEDVDYDSFDDLDEMWSLICLLMYISPCCWGFMLYHTSLHPTAIHIRLPASETK